MQYAQREIYSQEKKDIKEDCMGKKEGRSYREQKTIVEDIRGQVYPVKVK